MGILLGLFSVLPLLLFAGLAVGNFSNFRIYKFSSKNKHFRKLLKFHKNSRFEEAKAVEQIRRRMLEARELARHLGAIEVNVRGALMQISGVIKNSKIHINAL